MKRALAVIALLTLLVGTGAAGFFLGFRMQERLLAKSERNPVKLEMQIATLEVEKQTLSAQLAELQKQIEAGVKSQSERAAQVATLEGQWKEAQAELEKLRARVAEPPPAPAPVP